MTELEQRIISGKGILITPSSDRKEWRVLSLFSEVIRHPRNEYLNFNYSPPKSRYGNLNFVKNGYIYESVPIEYEQQAFQYLYDPDGQSMLTAQCMYAGLLQSFVNLGTALNLNITSVTNNIKNWTPDDFFYDAAYLCCYADTAIRLTLTASDFYECPDSDRQPPVPPPPPNFPPPSYPPGTQLKNTTTPYSPPYDNGTDGGFSVPFPDDYTPPEPEPLNYRVAVDVKSGDVLIATGYTKTIASPNGAPTIVSVGIGGSSLATVTVNIPGQGDVVLGSTNYKEDCSPNFGTATGSFVLSTARVVASPCPPV